MVEVFEQERGRLHALAYRMLGSVADAEDVVQDAWIRWERLGSDGRARVERPAAWLTTTTSRLALDRLRAAKRQRADYVGPWLPEPVLTSPDPADTAELAESLTLGFLTVLDRLAPVERAVFLLVEVFGEPYSDVAAAVGRSPEACRQIAHRARERVRDARRDRPAPAGVRRDLVDAFARACALGEVDELRRLLTDDVVVVSDGGAAVHAARRPVVGFERASRLLVNVAARVPDGAEVSVEQVNGEPGLVIWVHGRARMVVALQADATGRVAAVRIVVNPEKLRAVSRA